MAQNPQNEWRCQVGALETNVDKLADLEQVSRRLDGTSLRAERFRRDR